MARLKLCKLGNFQNSRSRQGTFSRVDVFTIFFASKLHLSLHEHYFIWSCPRKEYNVFYSLDRVRLRCFFFVCIYHQKVETKNVVYAHLYKYTCQSSLAFLCVCRKYWRNSVTSVTGYLSSFNPNRITRLKTRYKEMPLQCLQSLLALYMAMSHLRGKRAENCLKLEIQGLYNANNFHCLTMKCRFRGFKFREFLESFLLSAFMGGHFATHLVSLREK